jgi:membrane peptidoglycan carboxypeptidase
LAVLVTLVAVLGLGVGVMFVVTPSVSSAVARVSALAARDGAAHVRGRVPQRFTESIVASEDSRFYSEFGIDPVGIARAAWMTATEPGVDPGGSTLSQQLAKQLYTHGSSSPWDVAEQMTLAVKLNLHYSKAQILRMYAGTVYFGDGLFGLHNAACGYFGVPPQRLSLPQASLLAGLVQAPTSYNPLRHLSLARGRQHYVLERLVATGKITPAQSRTAATAPLHLVRHGGSRTCPLSRSPLRATP